MPSGRDYRAARKMAAYARDGEVNWRWYTYQWPLLKFVGLPALAVFVLWTQVPRVVLAITLAVAGGLVLLVTLAGAILIARRPGIERTANPSGPALLVGALLVGAGLFGAAFLLGAFA